MDAGWFREPETRLPGIGDWEIYKPSYPSGFDGFLDTIRDAGMTEFHGESTFTCLAFEPLFPEQIDPITGDLPLF